MEKVLTDGIRCVFFRFEIMSCFFHQNLLLQALHLCGTPRLCPVGSPRPSPEGGEELLEEARHRQDDPDVREGDVCRVEGWSGPCQRPGSSGEQGSKNWFQH